MLRKGSWLFIGVATHLQPVVYSCDGSSKDFADLLSQQFASVTDYEGYPPALFSQLLVITSKVDVRWIVRTLPESAWIRCGSQYLFERGCSSGRGKEYTGQLQIER